MLRAINRLKSHSFLAFSVLVLLGLIVLPSTSFARPLGDVQFVLANDFLASNEKDDDLYTAALELQFSWHGYQISFGENIFTDREDDIRFDETYLTLERNLPRLGLWYSSVGVGVVHVGEGILGESAQNAVHRLTGDSELNIPYVEANRVHPTLGVRLDRPLWLWPGTTTGVRAELYNAFDFQGHAAAAFGVAWPVNSWLLVQADLGARFSWTEFEALEERIEEFAPTWKFGFKIQEKISLNWDYNSFGTKSQHFNIAYHISSKEPVDGRGRMR